MITRTTDTARFLNDTANDLHHWCMTDQIDWSATLAQPTMTLIGDQDGSYALVERIDPNIVEGHIIIAPHNRGKASLVIARQMLAWIDGHIDHRMMMAKTTDRSTRLWLRRLGFSDQGERVLGGQAYRYYARFAFR